MCVDSFWASLIFGDFCLEHFYQQIYIFIGLEISTSTRATLAQAMDHYYRSPFCWFDRAQMFFITAHDSRQWRWSASGSTTTTPSSRAPWTPAPSRRASPPGGMPRMVPHVHQRAPRVLREDVQSGGRLVRGTVQAPWASKATLPAELLATSTHCWTTSTDCWAKGEAEYSLSEYCSLSMSLIGSNELRRPARLSFMEMLSLEVHNNLSIAECLSWLLNSCSHSAQLARNHLQNDSRRGAIWCEDTFTIWRICVPLCLH